MLRRRLVFSLLLCPLAIEAASWQTEEQELYESVLTTIASVSKAKRLAVFHESLKPDELVDEKVPRHWPKGQYSRVLPGVTTDMELELLYASKRGASYSLPALPWSRSGVEYLGLVDAEDIEKINAAIPRQSFESLIVVVKLSCVAYNEKRTKALVSAEYGRVGSGVGSHSEAFLFEKKGRHWVLRSHAGLWGGGPEFWKQ